MKKPTVEEIINHLTHEKKYDDFTAQGFATQFWHFYESKGWKVGRNPMVSWKSAIVTWEQKRKQNETIKRPVTVSNRTAGGYALLDKTRELYERRKGGNRP